MLEANTSRLLVNQLKKRKETAIRKADKATLREAAGASTANVFKGLLPHCLCNPPVSLCHWIKV